MQRLVVTTATTLLIIACDTTPAALTDAERAAITDTVRAVVDGFWDSWREADYQRGVSYWLNSPETAVASEGNSVTGFSTIDRIYRPYFAVIERQEIDIEETHIIVVERDVAYSMQRGTYVQIDTAGVRGPKWPFAHTILWIRHDGEWKLIATHQSRGDPVSE